MTLADHRPAPPPATVIRPPSSWPSPRVRELWRSRDLLVTFAAREVKLRYRQTVLGVAWIVISPFLAAGVFAFVFSEVARLPSQNVPYFLYAFVGMVGWTAFSNGLTRMSQCLVMNAQMVTKIYFERLTLALGTLLATVVDLLVVVVIAFVTMAAFQFAPTWSILTLPVWLVGLLALSGGLGLMAGALMVRYRDILPLVTVGTQLLLYISPVAYGTGAVPHRVRPFFEANPLVGLIGGLRSCMLGLPFPSTGTIVYGLVAAVAFAVLGLAVFRRQERTFADVI